MVDWRTRITKNPDILVGKPTVRGTRISVEHVLLALAAGVPEGESIGRALHVGEGRPDQSAVLDERARVGECGNALPSGPPSPPLLAGDGVRARGILEGGPRLLHLLQGDAWHGPPLLFGHHSALMFAARITSR